MQSTSLTPIALGAILLLAACSTSSGSHSSSRGSGGSSGSGGSGGGDVSAPDAGDAGDAEAPVTWPKECADLYNPDVVPAFDLVFTPNDWAAVQSDCGSNTQQYRPVEIHYNGESVPAMVRLKGNWSWNCQKMQFVVSFNEIDPKGRFHGLRKLVFDAPWYDRTLLHERLTHPFFKRRGLPYSCANSAKVSVNGQYYGVFTNVERLDKEYLQRNFEDADGNLYQAGAELKTNETQPDTSDIEALNAATTVDQIAALVDLDEAVSEWAVEAMLPAMDNYWAGVEINYYIYHHPKRGFLYLPYDMDLIFGDSALQNGDLIWPESAYADPITYEHNGWLKEEKVKTVLSDAKWCGRFVEELKAARDIYSPEEMATQVDQWAAQISQAVADDKNKTFSTAEHDAALSQLKTFFGTRAAFVDQWLADGNHCPASF